MNPEIQTSFKSYFEEQVENGEEVAKKDINELQLKDVDLALRESLMQKVDSLYASLKKANEGTKFSTLFEVEEVWQKMEAEFAELGEEAKLDKFFKHSNQ